MNIAGVFERRRQEPDEFSLTGHVAGAQTNLGRSARPEVWLRPKFREEVEVEAQQEAGQSERRESLAGRPQRLRGHPEG